MNGPELLALLDRVTAQAEALYAEFAAAAIEGRAADSVVWHRLHQRAVGLRADVAHVLTAPIERHANEGRP